MERLGDQLRKDPRIAEAKKLLVETVRSYQDQLDGPKPPDPSLKKEYAHLIDQFAEMRAGKLFYPYLGSGIGKGALVELLDGSVKYDFISGIGPHFWGHSYPQLIEAGVDAAISDLVMQGNLQQNEDGVELSRTILEASGMDHIFITSSGAMANENGLKIAFQKRFPASRVLAFDGCFMGRTLVMSQLSDKPKFREGLPHILSVDYIPFYDPKRGEASTKESLRVLEKLLNRYPGEHAVMCMELVQGEAGFWVGCTDFFKRIIELLKKHDVLFLADEIQSFGRTEQLFAYQHFELQEEVDIVIMGKMSQVCATLFKSRVLPKPGLLSQTFTSSTSAIRAGQFVFNHLADGHYYGPEGLNAQLHRHFAIRLQALADKYPEWVEGPFGIGSMIAFTPFDGSAEKALSLVQRLFDNGVLSFIAGGNPTRVRFLIPAAVTTPKEINAVVDILEKSLQQEAG